MLTDVVLPIACSAGLMAWVWLSERNQKVRMRRLFEREGWPVPPEYQEKHDA